MISGVLYLIQAKGYLVFGLNIYPVRFLEIAGCVRVMARREFSFNKFNQIDGVFVLFYSFTSIVFLMRSTEGFAYQIGIAIDASLCYFIFRGMIWNIDDLKWFLRMFPNLLFPFMILLLVERIKAYNPFGLMGASFDIQFFRDGVPRCMGSFRHPAIMGTLGASFLPLYIGLFLTKIDRIRALFGIALCFGIVWLSNSGGPITAVFACMIGWGFWFMRKKFFLVRRSLVVLIVLLALVMKSPIWYLPARISSITGGDGWHRSYLMQMAISHIDKWWVAGMPILETRDWFPYYVASGGADITNIFISFGITGGILSIILFIYLLTKTYQNLGKALAAVRFEHSPLIRDEYLLWGLGVMLFVHIVTWLGITYFDQFYVIWFMQLAAISSISEDYCKQFHCDDENEIHFETIYNDI